MRRVLTTTTERHPDTPESLEGEGLPREGLTWMVYIDGRPFIGLSAAREGAASLARNYASKALKVGRAEYVDVALVPERREGERRSGPDDGSNEAGVNLRHPDRLRGRRSPECLLAIAERGGA